MSNPVTPSEELLARLGRHAFLRLWSYSNLFTDRGRQRGTGDGKELCDLLVVFGDTLIIFSDKHCILRREPDELIQHLLVVKYLHQDAMNLVGIAVDGDVPEISEDAIYLDGSEWTEEMAQQAHQSAR